MQNQPPVQVSSQPPAQAGKSSTGLDENIAALLAYILGLVGGLVFFLIEKDSRFVRFHAMQSILLSATAFIGFIVIWVAWIVIALILATISEVLASLVSIVFGLLFFLFWIAILIGLVMCLVKAFQKQYFKLPLLGNFAEKFSTK